MFCTAQVAAARARIGQCVAHRSAQSPVPPVFIGPHVEEDGFSFLVFFFVVALRSVVHCFGAVRLTFFVGSMADGPPLMEASSSSPSDHAPIRCVYDLPRTDREFEMSAFVHAVHGIVRAERANDQAITAAVHHEVVVVGAVVGVHVDQTG